MRKIKNYLFILLSTFVLSSINSATATDANYRTIPLPNTILQKKGKPFVINEQTTIVYPKSNIAMERNAKFLSEYLFQLTGIRLSTTTKAVRTNTIVLRAQLKSKEKDSYQISINHKRITINGRTPQSVFYGIQTLRKATPTDGQKVSYPPVQIFDFPRFQYRGMHLDVARHFQPVSFIKKYIDILALHHNNKMHWHLTEDQGWRIEIKKYPKLTEVGAWRSETVIGKNSGKYDGTPHGGFYTQEEIKEIVKYAQDRYITIIPEIDLPGHMLAALAAYPELGCTGGPYEVEKRWGVFDDVLCAGQEKTYKFLEDVLTEVIELFPSEYIHIGGDESPKTRWKECPRCQAKIKELGLKDDHKHAKEFYLQSYVTERVEKFLNQKGRRLIGWDEILEGKLAPNATVMSWRGTSGGVEAANMGHDVIMTPNTYTYFDYYQTADIENEPLAIGGHLPIRTVYNYEPYDGIPTDKQKHILGVQANVWTEYMKTSKYVEYMVMPRIAALSEVQWVQANKKDYNKFLSRLPQLLHIYDKLGYNYATHVYNIDATFTPNTEKGILQVTFKTTDNAPIYYTTDGSEPTATSNLYQQSFPLNQSAKLRAKAIRKGGKDSRVLSQDITFSKSSLKPIQLLSKPDRNYTYTGKNQLNDGIKGIVPSYNTGHWMGFQNEPLIAIINLQKPTKISKATIQNCIVTSDWVMDAQSFSISISTDGKNFSYVAGLENNPNDRAEHWRGISTHTITFAPISAQYVRIEVKPLDKFPQWHGAKGKPYVFVDEISID